MNNAGEKCVYGPALSEPIPECSVAEYFIPVLKSHPQGNVIQVDSVTGYEETSSQLLEKSLRVSEGYRKLGFGQNDTFCLISKNSSDTISAALGVWWLGGVLAPLDPDYKSLEMEVTFRKLQPTVVVCDGALTDTVESAVRNTRQNIKIVALAERTNVQKPHIAFEELLKAEVDVNTYKPEAVESPSRVVLIMPTSGSTGTPKGVGITHRNILYNVKVLKEINKDIKSFLVTSHFYWITCIIALLLSLETGMKRIYMTDTNQTNVLHAINKYRPEWAIMGPTMLYMLGKQPNIHTYDFSCFKEITIGGAALTKSVFDSIRKIWKNLALSNAYGLTELSGILTKNPPSNNIIPAGKVVPGAKMKVVHPDTGKTLGPNETGEIYAASPGLMKGYINDETETKAAILDGWCRTGDLGYYDESETFYVIDRIKEMIKNLGNKQISPSEIEGVIECIPGVAEAGVVGIYPAPDKFILAALVSKKQGSHVTEDIIKNEVKGHLADFKQLGAVKFIEKLPRNSVGKLRRRDLKQMAANLLS